MVTEKPASVFQNYLAMCEVVVHFNVFNLLKEAEQVACRDTETNFASGEDPLLTR
ncbi:MAG: hypothetical protein JO170_04940 [Verrucomicrobia bacterium]|nr:hypothetical protein [Verrucomicrobiota bacterium]